MDNETLFKIFLFANQKSEQENQLWSTRTSSFLTASAFLFLGVITIRSLELPELLSILVIICGLFLCLLQNRNAWAARKAQRIWMDLEKKILSQMEPDISEPIIAGDIDRTKVWGDFTPMFIRMFLPNKIYEYWLPGTMAVIWISTLITFLILVD
ncbi:hypothetical protein ACFLXY_06405 [Chloroflexota bacterium]